MEVGERIAGGNADSFLHICQFGFCFFIFTFDRYHIVFYITMAIYLVLWLCVQVYYARMHKILSEECDPFKAEEFYTYYYLAFAKKKLEKKRGSSSKWLYHLYISSSVLLQGDFERAFFILKELIDLHCSLNRGDFSVYEYLSRQPEWTKGARLQRVSAHWMDAKVHNMQKNQEAAILDCNYVIENGNRLCYVSLAKQMLSCIESYQKGRADEIPVQSSVYGND